jgi:DNA-binding LacI/PurR family transcriptional regulator
MPVTQQDVAAKAGVSRALVSLVMRNSPQVSPIKREAVMRAAEELGYRRNAHAAQLASRRAMTLGLVLNEPQNPVYTQVLKDAEEQAESAGYGLLLTVSNPGAAYERTEVNRLLGHRVDGIVLIGTRLAARDIHELSQQVPVVVVGRRVIGIDVVSIDDRAGARLAVEHLVDLGHQRIAHVDGGSRPGARIRRRTYLETMRRNDLGGHSLIAGGDNTEPGGVAAAEQLLSEARVPTAIVASNDLAAVGVLGAAKHHGIRIPDELSVVGFDNTPLCDYTYVDLTSISQPPELGAAAVDTLLERIRDPERPFETRLLPPSLVVRGTTAPPPRVLPGAQHDV